MNSQDLFEPYTPRLGFVFEAIAPERQSELAKDRHIDLEVFSADEFIAESISKERLIRISTGALTLFWCVSHLNYVVCHEYPQVQASGVAQWDIMNTQRSRNAVLLVKWALEKVKDKRDVPWPQGMPKPNVYAQAPSDVFYANQLFYKAIAFVMHHERAHIEEQHPPNTGPAALPNERTADQLAAEWILGKAPTERDLQDRAMGIVSAILAFYRIEHLSVVDIGDHPSPMERIDRCFSHYLPDLNADANAFAAILVQVHGTIATEVSLSADAETHGDLLNEFKIAVARAGRRRG